MSVSEAARLALYNRLGEVIGQENAETLMSSLPPQPVVNLATSEDIDQVNTRIDLVDKRIDRLEKRIDDLSSEIHRQTYVILGAMTALTGIFSVIVGIIT